MSSIRKNLLLVVYNLLGMSLSLFLLTLFYYYNIFSDKTYSFFKLFIFLLSILICSFFLGKRIIKKGFFMGILYGSFFVIISFITTMFLSSFHISVFLFYLLILFTSILGSSFGISRQKKEV